MAIIKGVKKLSGTTVKATDLRGGAALVLAAISSAEKTTVCDIEHIERGYEDFVLKLRTIGVDIIRVE